ncbi:hypothetical protein [Pseudarthrobacter raffinosi]|nr:hypothetical protein [Pseudarthrobacter sp. MDT3-9]MCO4250591.1 hypothetical protein [Pseudarthrobacter sp. MDT3-9]
MFLRRSVAFVFAVHPTHHRDLAHNRRMGSSPLVATAGRIGIIGTPAAFG